MVNCNPETADVLADLALNGALKQFLESEAFQKSMHIEIPVRKSPFELVIPCEIKSDTERIIAGYASVELIDRQGDIIPLEALKKAWDKFIASPEFMISQVMHTNIPIGKILMEYRSPTSGKPFKSGVDESGLFIIVKIRNDIKKGDETWMLIKSGELKGFSIGGEALHRTVVYDDTAFTRIDELELHEISVVTKPANQGSYFAIIKCAHSNDVKNTCNHGQKCWNCPNSISIQKEDLVKLDDAWHLLPDGMVLIKDFINMVGSTVEKGQGHDYDFQVRENLGSEFIDRALKVRFSKLLGEKAHVFLGDPQGPHDSFIPTYDLVLIKHSERRIVPMNVPQSQTLVDMSNSFKKMETNLKTCELLLKLRQISKSLE